MKSLISRMSLYRSYYHADSDVLKDREVQGLANEMSSEGVGKDGGKGKVA